jgi:hypothetical protein
MSSLLEEAIVDAKALKEAALKNAETAVLERYSGEVKTALDRLLEQDELGLEEDTEADPELTEFINEVPMAFATPEIDGVGPDDIIEIDFDALKERLNDEEEVVEEADLTDALALAEEIALEEAVTGIDDVESDAAAGLTGVDQENEDEDNKESATPATRAAPSTMSEEQDDDEDINLTEEMLSDLIEELIVDMNPVPQGWASVNSADNMIVQANNDAMGAAQAAHLEEDEEIEEDVDTAPDVVAVNGLNEAKISQLKESTRELRALLLMSKNQLTKLNLDNAKLVYQNKALNSASLNERQKQQIVEAVQSANSVEETGMIFETIQNAVGSAPDQRTRPQTLREAVQRPTSLLLNSKKNNEANNDPRMGRMLRLAGLNK